MSDLTELLDDPDRELERRHFLYARLVLRLLRIGKYV